MSQPAMNLSTAREWARFYARTSPAVVRGLHALTSAALDALDLPDEITPEQKKMLHLCVEEFYTVGEVIAVPQEDGMPVLFNPGQVGVMVYAFGGHAFHWSNGTDSRRLPSDTHYLRRPTSPYDLRGTPAIDPEGRIVEPSDFEIRLFSHQAESLVEAILSVGEEPLPEDEDTGEEPAT